jgi:general secretion pathway protein E
MEFPLSREQQWEIQTAEFSDTTVADIVDAHVVCSECRIEMPTDEEARRLFKAFHVEPPSHIPRANGCAECRQTGYRQRVGVFEVAINTPEFAEAIEEGWSELQLHQLLRDRGTPSLAADALQKVREGVTTLEEVHTMAWVSSLAGTVSTRGSRRVPV